jgi:hypothetical protein
MTDHHTPVHKHLNNFNNKTLNSSLKHGAIITSMVARAISIRLCHGSMTSISVSYGGNSFLNLPKLLFVFKLFSLFAPNIDIPLQIDLHY